MLDDQIDNMDERIRKAAQSHHPAYEEKAWIKMAALLDQQLPQKKDRRRPVVLFVAAILIAMVLSLVILNSWNGNYGPAANTHFIKTAEAPLRSLPEKDRNEKAGSVNNALAGTIPQSEHFIQQNGKEGIEEATRKPMPDNRLTGSKSSFTINGSPVVDDGFGVDKDETFIRDRILQLTDKQPWIEAVSSNHNFPKQLKQQSFNSNKLVIQNDLIDKAAGKLPEGKNVEGGFQNNFAITLSAGTDVSFVHVGTAGKARLYYGAGLSYTFAKRITLGSGFYIGNKTYSAAPGDYHPLKRYLAYYPNLQRVDGDCKVYEIPLSASYSFKQSKNHSWMAGIGFSTFLMKSETYHYLYNDSLGRTMYTGWTLRNKNRHYFSVMTISAGYQYQVNPHFSIIAAPYFKLPLHGIGFGKIKLNSGGLLFTAAIRPFAKRN